MELTILENLLQEELAETNEEAYKKHQQQELIEREQLRKKREQDQQALKTNRSKALVLAKTPFGQLRRMFQSDWQFAAWELFVVYYPWPEEDGEYCPFLRLSQDERAALLREEKDLNSPPRQIRGWNLLRLDALGKSDAKIVQDWVDGRLKDMREAFAENTQRDDQTLETICKPFVDGKGRKIHEWWLYAALFERLLLNPPAWIKELPIKIINEPALSMKDWQLAHLQVPQLWAKNGNESVINAIIELCWCRTFEGCSTQEEWEAIAKTEIAKAWENRHMDAYQLPEIKEWVTRNKDQIQDQLVYSTDRSLLEMLGKSRDWPGVFTDSGDYPTTLLYQALIAELIANPLKTSEERLEKAVARTAALSIRQATNLRQAQESERLMPSKVISETLQQILDVMPIQSPMTAKNIKESLLKKDKISKSEDAINKILAKAPSSVVQKSEGLKNNRNRPVNQWIRLL